MMKVSFILCGVLFSCAAFSKAVPLHTELHNLDGKHLEIVELLVTNTMDKKICVDSRMIGLSGDASTAIFKVYRDHNIVGYEGVLASKVDGFVPQFVVLLPRQYIKVQINLASDYDLSKKGKYEIKQETFSGVNCNGEEQFFELISNVLVFSRN